MQALPLHTPPMADGLHPLVPSWPLWPPEPFPPWAWGAGGTSRDTTPPPESSGALSICWAHKHPQPSLPLFQGPLHPSRGRHPISTWKNPTQQMGCSLDLGACPFTLQQCRETPSANTPGETTPAAVPGAPDWEWTEGVPGSPLPSPMASSVPKEHKTPNPNHSGVSSLEQG